MISKSIMKWSLIAIAMLIPFSAHAEEGGSGHYLPGAAADFIDALPGKPGWAIVNFVNYYSASASAGKQMPYGGTISAGLDARAYSDTIVGVYQTQLQLLGGSYAVGVAIPYVWVDVTGNILFTGPFGGTRTGSVSDRPRGVSSISRPTRTSRGSSK